MSIPVFCSYIRRKDMDTVLSCLVTDSVGPGEYLERFQKMAKESFDYDFGIAVRTPYHALSLALEALGLSEGSVVLLPALAPAYYSAVLATRRLIPLFYDAAPDSAASSAESLGAAIDGAPKKPSVLIVTGIAGVMPDPEAVRGLGLPIIEDLSHSLGAYWGETKAGGLGALSILGLEHGGLITAGGGALLFAQGRREAQVLRNLAEGLVPELRMTDYNAALGLAQLKDFDATIEKRRELYRLFSQTLARTRHRVITQGGEGEPGFWALPVLLASGAKDVRAYAKKKEVETEFAFEGSCIGRGLVPEGTCPNARSLLLRTVLFPIHQRVGAAGAQKISKVLATLP